MRKINSDVELPSDVTTSGDVAKSAPSLSGRARMGVIWNVGFNLFRDLTQFGTMLVLVRLLPPSSYGEFGMTTGVIGFIAVFGFSLVLAHSLQVQSDAQTHYQQHFTAGAVLNGAAFLAANATAAVLWFSPRYSQVAPFVHVMSITYILEWPCELRRKMLERDLDWKRLRLMHGTGIAASAIVSVLLARANAGTWALLLPGLLVTVPFTVDLFLVQKWRPTWEWKWSEYRAAFQFGVTRMGSSLAVTGKSLLESSVLTAVFGFAALGFYNRAIGLATILCAKFATQLLYSVYPALTRLESSGGDPIKTGDLLLRVTGWISVPLATLLAVLAAPVVSFLYGRGWEPVIELLPPALLVTVLVSQGATTSALLLARQEVRKCLASDLLLLVGTGVALTAAISHGVERYLYVMAGVSAGVLILVLSWLTKARGATWSGFVISLAPPAVACGAAVLVLEGANVPEWLDARVLPVGSIILCSCLFLLIYIVGLRVLFPSPLRALLRVLPASVLLERVLILTPSQGVALSR